ncbi:MAG: hypothetical protein WA913_12175 [Pricia sp.]
MGFSILLSSASINSNLTYVNHVLKYRKGKDGRVVVSNGKELLVSASSKKEFLVYF